MSANKGVLTSDGYAVRTALDGCRKPIDLGKLGLRGFEWAFFGEWLTGIH
jgi:hypothetical protein